MKNPNRWWYRGFVAVPLLSATMTLPSYGRQGGDTDPPTSGNEITVGALLSLTGNWHTLGIASQSALELAARDINTELTRQGVDARVRIVVRDTKLDPDTARRELQALAALGVKLVIGPQSSAEVQVLKPDADQNEIVLISLGSTASSLAIAGDNVFRFVPDDSHEGAAIAALMRADGILTVIPIWRDDVGNQDLADAVKRAVAAGGSTVTDGVRYAANDPGSPSADDFSTELAAIKSQVSQAVARSGAASVAVFLSPFEEAAAIFNRARTDPVLSSVRWYGSDGIALSKALLAGPTAEFAVRVGYACPIYGLDEAGASKWQPMADQIRARTGVPPDALALSAYDALWVTALAAIQAGGTHDITAFKKAFVETAASYSGITGSVALNDAGDRRSGSYDFWAVCAAGAAGGQPADPPAGDAFAWKRVAVYRLAPDGTATIARLPGCLNHRAPAGLPSIATSSSVALLTGRLKSRLRKARSPPPRAQEPVRAGGLCAFPAVTSVARSKGVVVRLESH